VQHSALPACGGQRAAFANRSSTQVGGRLATAPDHLRAARIAAEADAVAVNGETAATAYGRAMHQTYDYGPGFRREFELDSGRRADAVNLQTREVIELKPNNPRQIRQGNQQLQGYIDELNQMYPTGPWFTGRVETYDRP